LIALLNRFCRAHLKPVAVIIDDGNFYLLSSFLSDINRRSRRKSLFLRYIFYKSEHMLPSFISLADNLQQRPLLSPPVELTVKYLLPRAEVESSCGNGNHYLSAHNLPLHVSVGVIFSDIMKIL